MIFDVQTLIIVLILLILGYIAFKYPKKNKYQTDFNLKKDTDDQLKIYENLKIGSIFVKDLFDKTFVDISEIAEFEDCIIYALGFIEYINGDLHNSNRFIKVDKNTTKILGKSLSWELFR